MNITLSGGNPEQFSPTTGNKARMSALATSMQHCIRGFVNTTRKKKKKKCWNRRSKTVFCQQWYK